MSDLARGKTDEYLAAIVIIAHSSKDSVVVRTGKCAAENISGGRSGYKGDMSVSKLLMGRNQFEPNHRWA